MPNKSTSPAIIAHRGGCAYAPENTLAAFKKAAEQGADGIELDVRLSADGEVVVFHDADLDRTTNATGAVNSYPLAALKEFDAGSWFSDEFAGEKIPTLREVLDLVGDEMLINIELKGPVMLSSRLPEKVAGVVTDSGGRKDIIFSSFNPWLLRHVGRLLPGSKLGMLLPPGAAAIVAKVFSYFVLKPWSYHPHHSFVTPSFVRFANQFKRPILAYTVNKSADLRRLCGLGIYGIITDDPLKAMTVRGESS